MSLVEVQAITCYTGGEELVQMTERMIRKLRVPVIAVGQGVEREVDAPCHKVRTHFNAGFALGINRGIQTCYSLHGELPDYLLVINNDIEPPDYPWFEILLQNAKNQRSGRSQHIVTPATDRTGYKVAQQAGPKDGVANTSMVGAFCWLVPKWIPNMLRSQYGFWLFDPDFGLGYGEDDYTAAILRKTNKQPFKIVRSAWVRHLRSQTTRTVNIDRKKQFDILHRKLKEL